MSTAWALSLPLEFSVSGEDLRIAALKPIEWQDGVALSGIRLLRLQGRAIQPTWKRIICGFCLQIRGGGLYWPIAPDGPIVPIAPRILVASGRIFLAWHPVSSNVGDGPLTFCESNRDTA